MANLKTPKSDLVGNYITAATSGLEMIGDNIQATTKDWSNMGYDDYIKSIEDMQFGGSNANIIEQASTLPGLKPITARDLGYDGMADDILSHTGKGAALGASIGSIIPVIGTGIGAAAGAILGAGSGWLKGSIDKRRSQAEADALMEQQSDAINSLTSKINSAITITDKKNDTFMKRQFAEGGDLTSFDTGGSHEQNPFGGIPQGIGMDGNINLVEEGETKYNNYIYSKRIKLTNKMCKDFNLPDKYVGLSMAEVSKKIATDTGYDKAPNDNISRRGFDEMVGRLKDAQENYKALQVQKQLEKMTPEQIEGMLNLIQGAPQQFAYGGNKGKYHYNGIPDLEDPFATEDSILPSVGLTTNNVAIPLESNGQSKEKDPSLMDPMSYAPMIANATNVITDAFGLTNKVDTTDIEALSSILKPPTMVGYKPTGRYQEYLPVDEQPLLTRIDNQRSADISRIADLSNGNRATALANLAVSGKGYSESIGDLALKLAEVNTNRKNQTIAANNAIDARNADQDLSVASRNAAAQDAYQKQILDLALQQLSMKENQEMLASQARNTNQNLLIEDLSKYGRYNSDQDMINRLASLLYDKYGKLK